MNQQELASAIARECDLSPELAQSVLASVLKHMARLSSDSGAADQASANGKTARFIDDYLPHLLARASSLISAEFHATLTRQRIPSMHWRVLACIADGPLPIVELADATLAKQPTISKLIDRMESDALVKRIPDPGSRRRILVALMPKGKHLVEQLIPLAREHARATLQPLPPETAAELIHALQRLIGYTKGKGSSGGNPMKAATGLPRRGPMLAKPCRATGREAMA